MIGTLGTTPPTPAPPARATRLGGRAVARATATLFCLAAALPARPGQAQSAPCPAPVAAAPAAPAPPPPCDNEALTAFDGLLVLAPHPDDETVAFAGLITAYMRAGKPVDVVVVTDGDGYCDACRFWKSASMRGPMCGAEDLSNLATPAADSFGEVRRCESVTAAAILGRQPPRFLGYPDTGLGAAWSNLQRGEPARRLRRSDFSRCAECDTCQAGYGGGPETSLTAAALQATLAELLAATGERTLVATTHWLDGHGDHAALGNFVRMLNAALARPRRIAFAVVHAKTAKSTPHSDCWYPAPQALVCPCLQDEERALADPTWIADLRRHRTRPDLPAALPDDAPYGAPRHLCLPDDLVVGAAALKLAAVGAYRSQLGSLARNGAVPASLDAITDCNGYLIAFVRRTEVFVLEGPAAPARR
jgi:LmbE family N-acetylglucosaminyl deacetylase